MPRCLRNWIWKTNCALTRWRDTGTLTEHTHLDTHIVCPCTFQTTPVSLNNSESVAVSWLWLRVYMQSIISSSVCLQIFVYNFVILCGFLYASITRVFVFAQPVNPLHWLLCSAISALTVFPLCQRRVCFKPSAQAVSYNWGQISKSVHCQNISTMLCLHLLLSKIHKSRSALNNFYSKLPLSSAPVSSPSDRPAACRAAGSAWGRGEDPPSSGALSVGQWEFGGGPTSGKVSPALSLLAMSHLDSVLISSPIFNLDSFQHIQPL